MSIDQDFWDKHAEGSPFAGLKYRALGQLLMQGAVRLAIAVTTAVCSAASLSLIARGFAPKKQSIAKATNSGASRVASPLPFKILSR